MVDRGVQTFYYGLTESKLLIDVFRQECFRQQLFSMGIRRHVWRMHKARNVHFSFRNELIGHTPLQHEIDYLWVGNKVPHFTAS